MEKTDVIIIGSGLFGSMTAKHFINNGMDVIVLDREHEMSASKCSFGIFKMGWIKKIQDLVLNGLEVITQNTEYKQVDFFDLDKEERIQMDFIDCSLILNHPYKKEKVDKIIQKRVICESGNVYFAKKAIIVAAGVWTNQILAQSGIKPRTMIDAYWGATFDVEKNINISRIYQWAPYKQCVLFKNENGFVFSDGSTVKNPSTDDKRLEKVGNRMMAHLYDSVQISIDVNSIKRVKEGYRPYISKEASFIQQHQDFVWSATGGAKNSTVLCGYIAKTLFEQING